MAHLQEVIVVSSQKGKDTEESPIRRVTEYWSKGGELLATNSSHEGESLHEDELDLSGYRRWLNTLGRTEEQTSNQAVIANVGRLITEIERLRQ